MIKGEFAGNGYKVPLVKIPVTWGQSIQTPFFIIDTGFTGYLQVTPEIAQELGLKVTSVTNVGIANGDIVAVPTALAFASMEGKTDYVEVLISKSSPLAGISLLSKFSYKAIIDCKNKSVELKRVR